jgi:zinc D-Ala-D-Ala dipeptidase
MRSKNSLFLPIYFMTIVMSYSQSSCFALKSRKSPPNLKVISTPQAYKNSISSDINKRMVLVEKYVSPSFFDWKYATNNNFTRHILYKNPRAYVRLQTAEALAKVENELSLKGIGLKFFDAYRPYSVTKEMWKIVPDDRYAANPANGSGHNRGAAVDVTLVNLKPGEELPMPTKFDDFTEKAHHSYTNLPKDVIENRQLLKSTMEKYGFVALETEWWHYSLPNAAARFEVLDLSFKQMAELSN